jgi:hypothetical protein
MECRIVGVNAGSAIAPLQPIPVDFDLRIVDPQNAMEKRKTMVSRRAVIGLTAAGALVASGLRVTEAVAGTDPSAPDTLLFPLKPGSTIGPWTVLMIGPRQHGAIEVELKAQNDRAFVLEVLARDHSPGAAAAPGQTKYLAVHVRNRGDGSSPTDERQGIAAMALAQVIAANERAESAQGLLTLGERLQKHGDKLFTTA